MAWTTVDDVTDALGTVPVDAEHLDACVAAANVWCFNRRAAAGYVDDPVVAPNAAVALGATYYAVALYKERGTVDSYASFEAYAATAVPTMSFGQINRLLGTPKPAVDSPPPAAAAAGASRRAAAGVAEAP